MWLLRRPQKPDTRPLLAILDNGARRPPRHWKAPGENRLPISAHVDFLGRVHAQRQHLARRRADNPAARNINGVGFAADSEAGNGRAGYEDGPTGTATIEEPNGIATNASRDAVYFNTHRGAMGDGRGLVIMRRLVLPKEGG